MHHHKHRNHHKPHQPQRQTHHTPTKPTPTPDLHNRNSNRNIHHPTHAPTLTATNITYQSATLTIANHTGGTWYYKKTSPTPASAHAAPLSTGTTINITSLNDKHLIHLQNLLRLRTCTTELATETFTTLRTHPPSQPPTSPTNPRHSPSPTTPAAPGTTRKPPPHPQAHMHHHKHRNHHKHHQPQRQTPHTPTKPTPTPDLHNRTSNRNIHHPPRTPTLTATNITHQSATLTIANHTGGTWHYKKTTPTPEGNMHHHKHRNHSQHHRPRRHTPHTPIKPTPTPDLHNRTSNRNIHHPGRIHTRSRQHAHQPRRHSATISWTPYPGTPAQTSRYYQIIICTDSQLHPRRDLQREHLPERHHIRRQLKHSTPANKRITPELDHRLRCHPPAVAQPNASNR